MSHVRPRAIVDSALAASDAGLTDADNAALHDVAVTTIRRWRRDYQRLGKPRGQDQCTAQCPRCDGGGLDASAYAELLGWYLGDGHITVGRRGVHYLHVINDVRYVQSNTRIAHLLRTVKPGAQPHARSRPGSVVITAGWKHWPCLFPQHGPGRKHERPIVLADWQRALVEKHPAAFLRGLFHSDGSRSRNWASRVVAGERRRYDYPRWEFANRSADIIGLCRWALDLAGVAHRLRCSDRVAVSRREAVALLDSLIGEKG